MLKKASKPGIKISEEADLSIQKGKDPAFFHLLQKGSKMKFTRRAFWKLAGTGILTASIPESAFSNAKARIPDYSFIPLRDIADHLSPCFPDHAPRLVTSKSNTRQA